MEGWSDTTPKTPLSPHLVFGATLELTDDVAGVGAAKYMRLPRAPALRRPPPHRPRPYRRAARVPSRPRYGKGGRGGVGDVG